MQIRSWVECSWWFWKILVKFVKAQSAWRKWRFWRIFVKFFRAKFAYWKWHPNVDDFWMLFMQIISSESPFSPNVKGTLLGRLRYSLKWYVNRQPCQISPDSPVLPKICTNSQISPNLSKLSTKFRQICQFRHCLHFWTYLSLTGGPLLYGVA